MRVIQRKITGVVIAVMMLTICACAGQETTETSVQTLPVVRGNINSVITFIGNVSASQSSSLSWRTSGNIEEVFVEQGDIVEEGQILATLARDSLSSSVISAEIPLISAQDELESLHESETPKAQAYKDLADKDMALYDAKKLAEGLNYPIASDDQVDEASRQLDIARGYYDDAVEDFYWVRLRDSQDDEYVELQSAMLSALENYGAALNTYTYYRDNASENTKQQAAADVKVAQAEYDAAVKTFKTYSTMPRQRDLLDQELKLSNAQDTYNQRSIVSDINGTITNLYAKVGCHVERGDAAFQIDNTQKIYIPLDISEIDVVHIQNGQQAEISLDAEPEKVYTGFVYTVAALGEGRESRVTFPAYIEMNDADENVKIGMTAEVDIITETKEDVLLVPISAIETENGKNYVQLSYSGGARKVEVTIGLSNEYVAEVSSFDLDESSTIIVSSFDQDVIRALGLDPADYGFGMASANMTGATMALPNGDMPPFTAMDTQEMGKAPAQTVPQDQAAGTK